MTRSEAREVLSQLKELVANAKVEGFVFNDASANYGEDEITLKFTFKALDADGNVDNSKEEDFLQRTFKFFGKENVPSPVIGSVCHVDGKPFTIKGANMKASRNNVIITSANGKDYRTCPMYVRF